MSTPAPERLLGVIPKNRSETIRITRGTFRGHDLVNLRVWFEADGGEMRPGKAGLAFRVDKLDAVIAALVKARTDD